MIKQSILAVMLLLLPFLPTSATAANPVQQQIKDQPFDADIYTTEGSTKNLGVLVLGGSEGGKQKYLAQPFADAGYPTMALAYFKTKTTPEDLCEIPLEYFAKALDWMQANQNTPNGIVVAGGSKGAELALLLAANHPEIKGVIALAPSSVVWQGLPKNFWPARSSWTLAGQPLPYLPFDVSKGFDFKHLVDVHRQSLTQHDDAAKAAIEVEKINGPVLLLSGGEDPMWPSGEMGDAICRRLKEKDFQHKFEHIKYDHAGHTLNEYFMLGGTKESNQKARLDATHRMLEFVHNLDN